MLNEVVIRPATEADARLVLNMIKELADYERLTHEVTATEEKVRERLFGPKPCAEVLLAFLDRQPAGFAVYFFNFSTFVSAPVLYLEDIFVLPEFRGRGIGRELFCRLVSVAKEHGCERLDFMVLEWNKEAMEFYEQLGARALKDWVHFRMDKNAIEKTAQSLS
jgi:GNAT superfamily N-acetyltransferase